ncbi:hypothetical protein F4778DRAFT_745240 [Xylariomycetidae sp. FL2044]|nr:hypothetical protein F4778DRAFT_745240 [Xylariomycetidae sp. FL2044]
MSGSRRSRLSRGRFQPQQGPEGVPQPSPDADVKQWINLYERLGAQDINEQLSSPLYNRIPSEIRTLIFKYALTESPTPNAARMVHDPVLRSGHEPAPLPSDTAAQSSESRHFYDWLRPDHTEPTVTYTALLRTCRRVYLETHSVPLSQKEHVFWCARGPAKSIYGTPADWARELSKPALLPGQLQYQQVKVIRLFAQQYWLEDELWDVSRRGWFQNVETFRITLRRADWWHWENSRLPKINPYRGNCYAGQTLHTMHADMAAMQDGGTPPAFSDRAWGLAFEHMPKLKTLIVDFETAHEMKNEMENIVQWARNWKFPLGDDNYHLSAEDQPVEKWSWLGMQYHWYDHCRHGRQVCASGECDGRERTLPDTYGPRLYVWKLAWKKRVAKDHAIEH